MGAGELNLLISLGVCLLIYLPASGLTDIGNDDTCAVVTYSTPSISLLDWIENPTMALFFGRRQQKLGKLWGQW